MNDTAALVGLPLKQEASPWKEGVNLEHNVAQKFPAEPDRPISYAALLNRIDRKKCELDHRQPLPDDEQNRLTETFAIEYTYHSNAIEGNSLTLAETARVLQGQTVENKPLKDHLEAVGHMDAYRYVLQQASEKATISESIILEIHARLLLDRPAAKGVFRHVPVHIVGACHEPPPPQLVPEQLGLLLADHTENQGHPIERAALFHLRFEGIHPFVDGNGRTGRLLMNLDLLRQGYPPILIPISEQQRYYDCFDAYYLEQDPVPMIRLIGEAAEEQLDRTAPGSILEVR